MSNLNDNNLDDLLRRAADKYPLRTDGADFDKLVSDLERDPAMILPPVTEDRRRRRRFIWLFFLLPLAGGAYYVWHTASGGDRAVAEKAENETVGVRSDKDVAVSVNEGKDNKVKGSASGTGTVGDVAKKDASGNGVANDMVKGDVAAKKENVVTGGTAEKKEIKKAKNDNVSEDVGVSDVTKKDVGVKSTADKVSGNVVVSATGAEKSIAKEDGNEKRSKSGIGNINRRESSVVNNNKKKGNREKDVIDGSSGDGNISMNGDKEVTGINNRAHGTVSLAAVNKAYAVNIPVKGKTDAQVQKAAPAKDKIKLQKAKPSFYVGLLASPDLSVVRFQSVKSIGDNIGLLFGYSFNSRWAVETGIYYDRKKYYTNGEYFSKSKVPRLNDFDIKTVDGVCNMWEIPLNVRYNFSTGNRMKWFATTGLSTYLMSKESYTFMGTYYGMPNTTRTWPYQTPYKYWFSILNLSVGFEQRLGKIGNLRLEPFLRVPLSGIGTGSLSIMSAGLNIGITRRIW